MANEITYSVTLQFLKGNMSAALTRLLQNANINVTGTKYASGIQALSTSAEAISVGEVGTAGVAVFRNMDPTNSISIRIGAGGADVVTLKPLEMALFRLAASNPFAIASAGTPLLEYLIIED